MYLENIVLLSPFIFCQCLLEHFHLWYFYSLLNGGNWKAACRKKILSDFRKHSYVTPQIWVRGFRCEIHCSYFGESNPTFKIARVFSLFLSSSSEKKFASAFFFIFLFFLNWEVGGAKTQVSTNQFIIRWSRDWQSSSCLRVKPVWIFAGLSGVVYYEKGQWSQKSVSFSAV